MESELTRGELLALVRDLETDNAILRQLHAGACERIAAAHDVIARNAERKKIETVDAKA